MFVYSAKVLSVVERQAVVRSFVRDRGQPTEQVEAETRSEGWFLYLEGNISIGVGPDRPDIVEGDELRITIERVTK